VAWHEGNSWIQMGDQMKKLTDAQVITAHRNGDISNGEFVDEMKVRRHTDAYIYGLARANFTLRYDLGTDIDATLDLTKTIH